MKRIHFIISSFLVLILSSCTTTQYADSPEKQAQRLEQEKINNLYIEEAKAAITNQDFVLEGDQITSKRGRSIYVSPNTNFISLKDGRATVQIAFTGGYIGQNGIGGITVQGIASNIQTKTTKKGNTVFSMNVTGRGISAQIEIELLAGSNRAIGRVNPNFNSNRIILSGRLYTTENSSVFKAQSY